MRKILLDDTEDLESKVEQKIIFPIFMPKNKQKLKNRIGYKLTGEVIPHTPEKKRKLEEKVSFLPMIVRSPYKIPEFSKKKHRVSNNSFSVLEGNAQKNYRLSPTKVYGSPLPIRESNRSQRHNKTEDPLPAASERHLLSSEKGYNKWKRTIGYIFKPQNFPVKLTENPLSTQSSSQPIILENKALKNSSKKMQNKSVNYQAKLQPLVINVKSGLNVLDPNISNIAIHSSLNLGNKLNLLAPFYNRRQVDVGQEDE
jgi:hypothetical protein